MAQLQMAITRKDNIPPPPFPVSLLMAHQLGRCRGLGGQKVIPHEVTAPAFLEEKNGFLSHRDTGNFFFPSHGMQALALINYCCS